jgi:SnoaL-like domain
MSEIGIEARLARLEDRQSIEEIVFRFCRAADRSDLEAIPALFHPDAVDNHGLYEGDVPGLVEWLRGRHKHISYASHNVTNILIEFSGMDTALVESRLTVCIRYTPTGSAMFAKSAQIQLPEGRSIDSLTFGRYVDVFERRAGEWKIAKRVCVPDQHLFTEAEETEMSSPVLVKPQRNKDDLIYRLQRELAIL